MYHNFFGLEEQAFSIAVNPRYLYMSEQHREALAHLLYGIQTGGFVQLTGEVGTGKTTIVRCLLEQLPQQTDVAMILNPMASVPELLCSICDELAVPYISDDITVKTLTDSLHDFLLRNHAQGRNTVLLIDEAQLLSTEALEQVRLLTNLETSTAKLLNIILVGQPELVDILAQPSLRQLSQRITARFHLRPLSAEETRAYIDHRLSVAGLGVNHKLMPPGIAYKVYQFSGGIPRLINIICERMLLGAYAKNLRLLDDDIFAQAEREVNGSRPSSRAFNTGRRWLSAAAPAPWSYPLAAAGGGLVVALLVVLMLVFADRPEPVTAAPQAATEPSPSVENQAPADPEALAAVGGFDLEAEPQAPTASTELPEIEALPEPEPPEVPVWTREFDQAQIALFDYLGVGGTDRELDCPSEEQSGLQCAKRRLQTWNDLQELNRPSVLTLITPDRKLAYVPLVGLDEQRALVYRDRKAVSIAWSELATLWNGEVHHFWYRPPGFKNTIGPGDRGEAVTWLAEQFARLDDKSEPLTRDLYTPRLKQRVQIFQRQHQLEDDGILGLNTLHHLNQSLGLEKPLTRSFPDPEKQTARAEP